MIPIPPWLTGRPHDVHPRRVDSLAELAPTLRQAVLAALPPGATPTTILRIPGDFHSSGFFSWRYVPEQLLVFTPDGLLNVRAATREGEAPATTFVPTDCVLYVRSSLLLLYGRLEVVGAEASGTIGVNVEYNTVGWYLLEPALKSFVAMAAGCRAGLPAGAPERGVRLRRECTAPADAAWSQALPYKFANGLHFYGTLPGEKVAGVVFQPAIWVNRLRLLHRQVMPNTLLALTDRSLIVIEEERSFFRSRLEYGWIVTYVARDRIAGVELTPGEPWQELTVRLVRGPAAAVQRFLLEAGPASEWRRLWAAEGERRASTEPQPA